MLLLTNLVPGDMTGQSTGQTGLMLEWESYRVGQ